MNLEAKTIDIDINCDVGEGVGNEAALLPLISSCNIACGGHAGSDANMTEVARLAKKHGVKVGAHPSYPDKENFGRVSMEIPSHILIQSVEAQIASLTWVLEKEKVKMHHIKAHGALYNDSAKDLDLARTYLKPLTKYKKNIFLYVPYNSVIESEALKQNFNIKYEAFADRNYNDDLSLVSRKLPNALIEKPEQVCEHLLKMVKEKQLLTPAGRVVKIKADTFCVHGDTPSALQILMYLTEKLPQHNISIKRE